jgi:hypothetical protein
MTLYLPRWTTARLSHRHMALMSPATTEADVDRHTEVFGEAVEALFGD